MAESQELQEGVFNGVPANSRSQSVNAPVAAHLHEWLGHDGVDDALPGHVCNAFLVPGASRLISHMPQENLAHTQHRICAGCETTVYPWPRTVQGCVDAVSRKSNTSHRTIYA